jgi:RNA ligase
MTEYHKIDSVYLRDPNNKFRTFLDGQWACEEFGYLANNEWEWTEKVDGTNIRVIITNNPPNGQHVIFAGKEENSQLPAKLVNRLQEIFFPKIDRLMKMFPEGAILYGEGYGPGIQKGGGNYRKDQDLVLIDVKIGNWWLKRPNILNIAQELDLMVVPIIGHGTLPEMIHFTRNGFKSIWGDFMAEGIVARPKVELVGRNGKRIITKVKHKDFK